MRVNETAPVPTGAASKNRAAARLLDAPSVTDLACRRPSWSRTWPQVVERRRAARELDRLLEVRGYPDLDAVYGVRGVDDGC